MTIGIHRLRNVQTAWFLADNRKGKQPEAGDNGMRKALSESQTDAWAAKNVIERIEVLHVMACSFLCMKILKTSDYRRFISNHANLLTSICQ